jgi:hypothetical protein
MSVWGDDLDGRKWSESRGTSMTETAPPADYRWHHSEISVGHGNDVVASEYRELTKETHREMRLSYLDQFELEIEEEGRWRYWRWYGYDKKLRRRVVKWSQRRPINAPPPKTPGFELDD